MGFNGIVQMIFMIFPPVINPGNGTDQPFIDDVQPDFPMKNLPVRGFPIVHV